MISDGNTNTPTQCGPNFRRTTTGECRCPTYGYQLHNNLCLQGTFCINILKLYFIEYFVIIKQPLT